jgi:WD40 repeat protein
LRGLLNFPNTLEEQAGIPLSLSKSEQDVLIKGAEPTQIFLSGHAGEVGLATFIRNHSLILSHATDGTLRLWGVYENQLSRFLSGHETGVQQVAFSPDGSLLASIDYDGMLWLWDTKTRTPIGHWQIVSKSSDYDPKSVYFSGDGSKLFIAPPLGREIYVWDVNSQKTIFSLDFEDQGFIDALLFPNDDLIVVSNINKTTRNLEWTIYRLTDKSIVNQFEDKLIWSPAMTSALSPDGAHLAVLGMDDTGQVKINVYDLKKGESVVSIPIGAINNGNIWGGILFSPDGSKLTNGTSVWDTKSWRENLKFSGTSNQFGLPLRFTDDGESLAIFQVRNSGDEQPKPQIGIYRMQDGSMVNTIEIDILFDSEMYLPSVDISPDMNLIAAQYGDQIVLTDVPWDK